MPQLLRFRKGWQREHLAKFILSKFSLVAEPSTISDDAGTDFFCTLFRIFSNRNRKFLLPHTSFAIQIKSNKRQIEVTKKTNYLLKLEIPFFVGVVDEKNLNLKIYSGEAVDHFFSKYGDPTKENSDARVFIKLIEERGDLYWKDEGKKKYYLNFPKILEIGIDYNYENSSSEIDELFKVCSLIQENISSRKSTEYIYKIYKQEQDGSIPVVVYTGPGSLQTFRGNFFKRLAEVFCNLKWIYRNPNLDFDHDEFEMYEKIYHALQEHYGSSTYLNFAGEFYYELKSLIKANR